MTRAERAFTLRLTETAEADFHGILRWTAQRFGARQARAYAKTLTDAILALSEGPMTLGAKRRADIARGLFTLHVARNRRKGRHIVLFRVGRARRKSERVIEVLRIIHDSMDIARHVPPEIANE